METNVWSPSSYMRLIAIQVHGFMFLLTGLRPSHFLSQSGLACHAQTNN